MEDTKLVKPAKASPKKAVLHRIVCGLDFGTTFSGFAYGNTANKNNVELMNTWPGTSDTINKTPTRIAYPSENPSLSTEKWGFTVGGHLESHSWFKLLLDSTTKVALFDDADLNNYLGSGMLRVPANMSAQDVCRDYLRLMREYVFDQLRKKYGAEKFEISPHDFFITVPAIWSDAAKAFTRDAAVEAGFASREQDTLCLIAEPEAAALAALKPHLDPKGLDPIKTGEIVMVCDCGGGTTDITTYKIIACRPKLKFEEVTVGIGGKCGSTFIESNFVQLMEELFGDAFKSIPMRKRGPGSPFMRQFEIAKRAFSCRTITFGTSNDIEIEGLDMEIPSSKHYDADECVVKISWNEMKGLFDPVIKNIMKLIDYQRQGLKEKDATLDIDRVILVGGFGDSDYLNSRLKEWCIENGNKTLTCPPQCQVAVVRGAVIRGLEGLVPKCRFARRFYGYKIGMPFRKGIDPESLSYIDPWDGQKMCRRRVEWLVRKGQSIDEKSVMSHSIHLYPDEKRDRHDGTLTLVSCATEVAPEFFDDGDVDFVGKVEYRLGKKDLKSAQRKAGRDGSYMLRQDLDIELSLAPKEGAFTVKTLCKKRAVGRTKIKFDSN